MWCTLKLSTKNNDNYVFTFFRGTGYIIELSLKMFNKNHDSTGKNDVKKSAFIVWTESMIIQNLFYIM